MRCATTRRLGLLLPARTASGYRDYPESMRREVVFIAMARRIGFSLPAIGELLPAYRAGRLSITRMTDALEERAAALDRQIAELQALRAQVIEHAVWLRAQTRAARRSAIEESETRALAAPAAQGETTMNDSPQLQRVEQAVLAMPMARTLGLRFTQLAPGEVEIEMPITEALTFRPGHCRPRRSSRSPISPRCRRPAACCPRAGATRRSTPR